MLVHTVNHKQFTILVCIDSSVFNCIGAQLHTNHISSTLQINNSSLINDKTKNYVHHHLATATERPTVVMMAVCWIRHCSSYMQKHTYFVPVHFRQ